MAFRTEAPSTKSWGALYVTEDEELGCREWPRVKDVGVAGDESEAVLCDDCRECVEVGVSLGYRISSCSRIKAGAATRCAKANGRLSFIIVVRPGDAHAATTAASEQA
ncbi:MAG: hypothetical protein INR71_15815 [Terriglobus roseus]|nr:hypothetical protein [Terriglobus roseus]